MVDLKDGHEAEPPLSLDVSGPLKSLMVFMGNQGIMSVIISSKADFRVRFC